ncbi:hypothetical protein [Saccharopolyspora pogona]|uniref:hypothetical protein n=1 Tax=Saccharopolyspora pogona TaxID=333966 RepID=UPI001686EF4D|nr:hypothetical protein [Saccharopolyspora pogona]
MFAAFTPSGDRTSASPPPTMGAHAGPSIAFDLEVPSGAMETHQVEVRAAEIAVDAQQPADGPRSPADDGHAGEPR